MLQTETVLNTLDTNPITFTTVSRQPGVQGSSCLPQLGQTGAVSMVKELGINSRGGTSETVYGNRNVDVLTSSSVCSPSGCGAMSSLCLTLPGNTNKSLAGCHGNGGVGNGFDISQGSGCQDDRPVSKETLDTAATLVQILRQSPPRGNTLQPSGSPGVTMPTNVRRTRSDSTLPNPDAAFPTLNTEGIGMHYPRRRSMPARCQSPTLNSLVSSLSCPLSDGDLNDTGAVLSASLPHATDLDSFLDYINSETFESGKFAGFLFFFHRMHSHIQVIEGVGENLCAFY